jgi:ABC-type transport system substrate-binding protein
MRRRAFVWLALISFAALLTLLPAATRPRYGGTLTLQLSVSFSTLDPTESLPDPMAEYKRDAISPLVFETLVGMNPAGEIEPRLATSWRVNGRRWRFTLLPKAVFHDGQPVTGASIARGLQTALAKRYSDVVITAEGQSLTIQSKSNLTDLAAELSLPRNAIFRKGENGELIGTGPFRLDKWEPGRRAVFSVFEEHWAGRPYVDYVIVNLGPLPRQLTVNSADIWDLPVNGSRRVVPEGIRLWSSGASELVAIAAPGVDPLVNEALALSIDRAAIVNVLAQRRGETAGGLLPQWLTGYAFLFPPTFDLARARELLASVKPAALSLSYPPDDAFMRSLAERISLNARDAGLNLQPSTNPGANLRLIRVPLPSADVKLDLSAIEAPLAVPRDQNLPEGNRAEALYQEEQQLLKEHKVVPLVYLPSIYGIGPHVHDWDASQNGRAYALHLESVWLSP